MRFSHSGDAPACETAAAIELRSVLGVAIPRRDPLVAWTLPHGTQDRLSSHTKATFSSNISLTNARHTRKVQRVGCQNHGKGSSMIEVRNLSKRFYDKKRGEIRAVDGVSFRCKPGQIYGLLGSNGAGKTTTLRMLATILEPTDGTAAATSSNTRRKCAAKLVSSPPQRRSIHGSPQENWCSISGV
jgi:ABC-type glutathione transport system ATPase component